MNYLKVNLKILGVIIFSLFLSKILINTLFLPFSPKINPRWQERFFALINKNSKITNPPDVDLNSSPTISPSQTAYLYFPETSFRPEEQPKKQTAYLFQIEGKKVKLLLPPQVEKPDDAFVSLLLGSNI